MMTELGPLIGGTKVANLAITLDPDRASAAAVREALATIDPAATPASWITETLAGKLKFADCLPPDVASSIAATRAADPDAMHRVRSEPVDDVDAGRQDSRDG